MKKGPLCVLACYILWGLLPGYWKLLSAVPSLYVLASRIVWSLVFVGLLLALRHSFGDVRALFHNRRQWLRLMAAGVLITVNWGSFIVAVSSGHILDSSLAYYMNPILTILIGTLVFREKLTKLQWLSVGITAAGLVVTILRYGEIPWLALVIGGSFALYGAVKKGVTVDAQTSLLVETLTVAPFALLFLLWSEKNGVGAIGVLHGGGWLLLLASGIVTSVPLLFYAVGIRTTPYTMAGILMYINPTMQLLTGVFFYGETFTATHGILFGFVWTGLLLYVGSDWLTHRREKENIQCE
ncbi:MAG: EamA family transporter RarD [Oscillospiraceae bacterium]